MKRKVFFVCCLLTMLLLSSCSVELVNPDSLIAAPKSNQEKLQKKQLITSFLGQEDNLIVPEDMNHNDAYRYVDLDNDGEDEIVAFYANRQNNFILGFLVLDQRDQQWYLSHKAIAYGMDIHFFSAEDLDGDGVMELMLGVHTGYGSQKELYLYQLEDGDLRENTDGDRVTYDQMTLAQTVDGGELLVTARMDTSILEGSSNITVYRYYNGGLQQLYDETFSGYCSEIHFDCVAQGQTGVYLAMRHNHFVNILLLKETEENFAVLMEQPLPYDYEDMNDLKLFYDENSDGIVEINSLWEPEHNVVGKIYKDYIQVWLQWDGQDSVYAVDAILENVSDGYQFRVPLEWMDMLYYDFCRDENAVNWVDFYYENAEQKYEDVFSFAAIDQLVWENMEDVDSIIVLGNNPTNNKVYVAEIYTGEFNGFKVDASRLISCLKIEGGERK